MNIWPAHLCTQVPTHLYKHTAHVPCTQETRLWRSGGGVEGSTVKAEADNGEQNVLIRSGKDWGKGDLTTLFLRQRLEIRAG